MTVSIAQRLTVSSPRWHLPASTHQNGVISSSSFVVLLTTCDRFFVGQSIEGTLNVDPTTGQARGFGGIFTLRQPSAPQRADSFVSADALLALRTRPSQSKISRCGSGSTVSTLPLLTLVILEANALRGLFKVYLDTLQLERVNLKIFLRTDIWRAITEGGFREASHITRRLDISWNEGSLLNLLVRRLLQNADVVALYEVDPETVMGDSNKQRAFFNRLVPEKVDSGRNPDTYEWMLGRVRDGTGQIAPRELIHLTTRTRDVQVAMLERGDADPPGENLFVRQAVP